MREEGVTRSLWEPRGHQWVLMDKNSKMMCFTKALIPLILKVEINLNNIKQQLNHERKHGCYM